VHADHLSLSLFSSLLCSIYFIALVLEAALTGDAVS
jgi:hypothetical protein